MSLFGGWRQLEARIVMYHSAKCKQREPFLAQQWQPLQLLHEPSFADEEEPRSHQALLADR